MTLSQSDPLIIVKFDIPNPEQISPSVEYKVYDKEGNELSMDICKGINIEIGYPIIDKEKAQLTLGESMYKKGFDVYNPEDDFFNEKCVSFSNSSTIIFFLFIVGSSTFRFNGIFSVIFLCISSFAICVNTIYSLALC